jgi:hypothetical protein
MYGRTPSPIDEIDRINAAHVFSDILGMAHDSHKPQVRPSKKKRFSKPPNSTSPHPSHVLPHSLFSRGSRQFFVINVHRGEICLFWANLPDGYIESMRDTGRPPKTMRVTLYQGNKFSLFMRDGLAGFMMEFKNLYPRLIQSGEK